MLRQIVYFGVVVACIWVIADSLFGLENSWILFFARVFSPLLFVGSISIACTAWLISLRWPLNARPFLSWRYALLIAACAAPTIRSLILNYSPAQAILPSPSSYPPLRLLNFNVLGFADTSTAVLNQIAVHNPDIVTLQEVNPQVAEALRTHLHQTYPCQVLDPIPGSWGMGIISKFPCSPLPVAHTGHWVGKPQLVKLHMTETRSVAVANIHAIHPHAVLRPEPDKQTDPLRSLSDTVRAREDGIQQVLEAISALNEISVIIAGDLNATMRNTVYERIRSAGFIDSWLVNHSFINGGTWPSVAPLDLALPSALLRIDFVFHSRGLRTTQSEVLSSSLSSDHAGLLVVLSPI